ncbi:cell division cycle and apoptosis regulator protein 1 [Xenopus laevis]|uniref:Cell division cycle and apoptosis regulator protein 1 n=1 Tax=Xenopus laevis TaxID=8355 RepID=CCAR1_XENLA|nr:cell division cycle and apoptosis regulator protein 1 [Xenopus laevis]Q641G3.1 RecName: Full=Cell division cycle and apoptosis regulator protein 1 [Xenopus laevis]AAH82374.1 Ccar1 protein [Xenopus laevis]
MAQFGGQKNPPPWATQFTATAVSQPGPLAVQQSSLLGASPTIYTQQSALAAAGLASPSPANYQLSQTAALQQQAAAAAAAAAAALQQQYTQPQQTIYSVQQQLQPPPQAILTQPAVALPTSLALSTPQQAAQITVSYPTPRSNQQQTQPQKQRVFTGVVTKLHETFGFVDEDVFFQLTAVKGKSPQAGDRVLVEATYNPNMPFKWNAQRIQTLPNQNPASAQSLIKNPAAVMQPVAQPTAYAVQTQPPPQAQTLLQAQISAATLTPLLQTQTSPLLQQPQQKAGLLQTPVRIVSQPQPVRRIEPPSRFSVRNDRGDSILSRKDDRNRERERERRRSRDRSPQRKRSRERSPRRERERSPRRPRRVVPRYTVQISKFCLDCPGCDTMELRRRYQNLYIPSDFFDAQFTWVDAFPISRPFQLGNYSNFYIMHKEVDPLEKNTAIVDPPDADHTYSAKVMLLASPSLEELYHKSCALAEDPIEVREGFQHPARLIKFLVGMKGKDEAMAIGGHWSPSLDGPNPDKDPSVLIRTAVRCCKALTGIELSLCTQWYRFAEIRYHRPEETHKGRTVPAHVETVVLFFPDVWHCLPTRSEWENLCHGYKQQLVDKLQGDRKEADGEQEEEDKEDGDAKEISTPTHWSKLDPKIMKVNDLRKELESRTLSSKGLKSQLIARLTKQLRIEEQKEEQKELEKCEKEEEEEEERKSEDDKEEEERKRQEELERQRREKRYMLPDEPAIIVHPNWSAKNGKFDCSIMSLSVLLDYRIEDNKEHSFEVSLFAELFNEMLQRDFGVRIYRELLALPEKEEKKDKEKKCKKEDKRERKEDKDDDDEPKPKRRKSSDDKIKLEEKEERKRDDRRKEDYREEDDPDYENQDDYEPIAAEEDDGDYDDREDDDDDSSSKDKREDKRDGNRYSKERQSKDKEKDKKQMVTVNRDLLMAFVYFDQSHCGYLLEKDLEEILYTLGLHLSRAQVKKLFTKILLKESLLYRKLTDTATEDGSHEETDPLHNDILGNCSLLPSKAVRTGLSTVEDKGGLIVYKGAMVDVGSLLQKLEKSEKTRTELEHRLQTLESKTEEDEKTISQLEASNRNLSEELKQTKDDVGHLKDSLKAAEDTRSLYEDQLTNTIKNLSAAMGEIQVVLNKNPSTTEDQKSKENGSS